MDESTKRGLLAAYGRLLRPLIRILIRNEVTYGEFAEVAKETFVRVALEKNVEKEQNASSISDLTGLSAEEVREIENILISQKQITDSQFDEIVSILASWHTSSEFTGPYGLPLELPMRAANNGDFVSLVKDCNAELEPEQILRELIEAKAVIETRPGWFKVQTRYYIPEGSAPGGIEHLSRTIEDIANTLDHNHSQSLPSKKMFERHVYTEDGIREEDLPKFAAFAGERAKRLLEEVDNWLTNLEKPEDKQERRLSTGFGIFHYVHRDDARKK